MKDEERAVQTEAVVGLLAGLRSAAYDLFRTSLSARGCDMIRRPAQAILRYHFALKLDGTLRFQHGAAESTW
jgi:hypothetical protein